MGFTAMTTDGWLTQNVGLGPSILSVKLRARSAEFLAVFSEVSWEESLAVSEAVFEMSEPVSAC